MMKTLAVSIVLAVALPGCSSLKSDSQQTRQEAADHAFGDAKLALMTATGLFAVYNVLPPCSDTVTPPLCKSESIAKIVSLALKAATDVIASSERTFAAANTTDAKLDAAKAAQTAVQELMVLLVKYGVAGADAAKPAGS